MNASLQRDLVTVRCLSIKTVKIDFGLIVVDFSEIWNTCNLTIPRPFSYLMFDTWLLSLCNIKFMNTLQLSVFRYCCLRHLSQGGSRETVTYGVFGQNCIRNMHMYYTPYMYIYMCVHICIFEFSAKDALAEIDLDWQAAIVLL